MSAATDWFVTYFIYHACMQLYLLQWLQAPQTTFLHSPQTIFLVIWYMVHACNCTFCSIYNFFHRQLLRFMVHACKCTFCSIYNQSKFSTNQKFSPIKTTRNWFERKIFTSKHILMLLVNIFSTMQKNWRKALDEKVQKMNIQFSSTYPFCALSRHIRKNKVCLKLVIGRPVEAKLALIGLQTLSYLS